jgi:hypothetical protein
MLPPKVLENVQRAVTIAIDEQHGSQRETIENINRDYSRRGLGNSGMRIGAIQKALTEEAARIADAVGRAILDVYDAVGCEADDSHRVDLKNLFDESFRRIEVSFPATVESQARLGPIPGIALGKFSEPLRAKLPQLRNKQHLAIDMHIDRRLRKAQVTPSVTHNTISVAGPVGILQTGHGAVANISGSLSQSEQSAALEALTQAIAAIVAAPAGRVDTAQLLSAAAEASDTIKGPTPDKSRLREIFDVLSSGVQAIGSAPGAYAALQAVQTWLA